MQLNYIYDIDRKNKISWSIKNGLKQDQKNVKSFFNGNSISSRV